MSDIVAWIAAEAERGIPEESLESTPRTGARVPVDDLPVHRFEQNSEAVAVGEDCKSPLDIDEAESGATEQNEVIWNPSEQDPYRWWTTEDSQEKRRRRIYRGRTVAMLRRYMRYSIETGRLPSLLGREFFRSKVTSYTVVTFEDRVIFVHDMETCLEKLHDFSRELIARHILQEHDRFATARLLGCNEKTIRRLAPIVLDQLSDILLEVGLMDRLDENRENPCQGGENSEISVSDCKESKNKF